MDAIRSQLRDMGFGENKIQRALESCSEAQTLEQVMEWLIIHEQELNDMETSKHDNVEGIKTEEQSSSNDKKLETSVVDGEAIDQENESNANKAKKLTVEEAQKLILERQAKRAEEERKKEIENEKRRRVDGQKMSEVRDELKNQEMINLAAQIRREKLEKEQHHKRLLEQIALDRENMRQKNLVKSDNVDSGKSKASSGQSTSKSQQQQQVNREAHNECRIALRFPDGKNLMHNFSPKEQLSAVRLYVQTEKKTQNQVEFFAPPNKKLGLDHMDETLESLGLCPASRLEVKYVDGFIDLD